MAQTNRMPLDGIRVFDLTIWVQGPLASMMLADLGAEVIKVEKPGQGDFSRGVQTLFGQPQTLAGGRSLMFEIANRNKKAVGIDLHKPEGLLSSGGTRRCGGHESSSADIARLSGGS